MDVLLATCAELPDGDEDAAALAAALSRLGVRARWQVWTDPAALWSGALVVLRSTWDYATRRHEFLDWARSVPRLVNPYDVIEWNTDKTYLVELADAGIPTVPTQLVPVGGAPSFPDREFVVKPSVGAGSRGAGRFAASRRDEAALHVSDLHAAGHTVLVQPYVDGVDEHGERALIYVEGRYSHAVTKAAMLAAASAHPVGGPELYIEERITPAEATTEEMAVADRAVASVSARFGVPLYARIDLLPSADGPLIVELEVTEPSLFLGFGDGATERFATAIAARA